MRGITIWTDGCEWNSYTTELSLYSLHFAAIDHLIQLLFYERPFATKMDYVYFSFLGWKDEILFRKVEDLYIKIDKSNISVRVQAGLC